MFFKPVFTNGTFTEEPAGGAKPRNQLSSEFSRPTVFEQPSHRQFLLFIFCCGSLLTGLTV